MKLLNAFSLNMVDLPAVIAVKEITLEEAKALARRCESAVGHEDTAAVFSDVLGCAVACNRVTVTLRDERALVGQYVGPRLPEGCKTLPAGATIKWLVVTVPMT